MPATTVGAYEAKTHLPKLLERVEAGETITITRHGRPIAVLTALPRAAARPAAEVIAELKELRRGKTLGDVTLRELIDEGRR